MNASHQEYKVTVTHCLRAVLWRDQESRVVQIDQYGICIPWRKNCEEIVFSPGDILILSSLESWPGVIGHGMPHVVNGDHFDIQLAFAGDDMRQPKIRIFPRNV